MKVLLLFIAISLGLEAVAQPTVTVRKPAEEAVYLEVDEQPEYPYGVNPETYLRQQRYLCSEDGTVIVEVIIDAQGFASEPKISNSLSEDCDAEALRLVRTLGQWKPGFVKGKAVAYRYFLPIRFYKAQVIGRGRN